MTKAILRQRACVEEHRNIGIDAYFSVHRPRRALRAEDPRRPMPSPRSTSGPRIALSAPGDARAEPPRTQHALAPPARARRALAPDAPDVARRGPCSKATRPGSPSQGRLDPVSPSCSNGHEHL